MTRAKAWCSGTVWGVLAAAALLATTTPDARADHDDGPQSSISVVGVGIAHAKPTVVEIGVSVTGEAELAADASVKFVDLRKKAQAAIDKLNTPNLSIKSEGFGISNSVDPQAQVRIINGMQGAASKPKVQVAEQLSLVLSDADKLDRDKLLGTILKIIDTARDAGLQVGPPSPQNYYQYQISMANGEGSEMVTFKVPDATVTRDEAYRLAVEDAKAKAAKLAELSGVKLGGIVGIQEEGAAASSSTGIAAVAWAIANNGVQRAAPEKELRSGVLGDIDMTVRLNVQFAIEH